MGLLMKNSRCRVVALAGGGDFRDKAQRRHSRIIVVVVVVVVDGQTILFAAFFPSMRSRNYPVCF